MATLAAMVILALAWAACSRGGAERGTGVQPIPDGLLAPSGATGVPLQEDRPAVEAAPIAHVPIAQHPFMAANAGNNMHNDAYMSDTYEARGPLGLAPEVHLRSQGFGGYGTLAFDRARRLVGVYSNGRRFQLELMDPYTLVELAAYDLPARPWSSLLIGPKPWEYTGAGTYFYLDELDRAVVPTVDNALLVIQTPGPDSGDGFTLVRRYDLSPYVVSKHWPRRDSLAWLLPDWGGAYYWFATTEGMVGTVAIGSGVVHTLKLEGEIVENSFAVGEEGMFIVSDRALYRLHQDGSGQVQVDWRTPYDRGGQTKPGHVSRGAGGTVTLIGGQDGVVAITDNAEPQIHLLFLRRADGQVVGSAPLFEAGKSGTDVTVIGFEQADSQGQGRGVYSALVENNWGHHVFPFPRPAGGIVRVDLSREADGSYHCAQVWSSPETNIGVFKLSLGNGLLYLYFRSPEAWLPRWYLTAVYFQTGETAFRVLAGSGLGYDNWKGAIFLHPDGGIAYSTTLFGLVRVSDGLPSQRAESHFGVEALAPVAVQ